jgi:hypothetical protein
MYRPLEAHFICKGRTDVVHEQGVFVTGSWAVSLKKARLVGRVCLHENKCEAPFLSGDVTQLWINPDDGRVVFKAAVTEAVEADPVTNWSFMSAFRPISRVDGDAEHDALVRVVVRMGLVVAGADGLDEAETAEVEQYVRERSGLDGEALAEERARAAAGVASVTDEDIARIRALDVAQRRALLEEVRFFAAADGVVSANEALALEAFTMKIV